MSNVPFFGNLKKNLSVNVDTKHQGYNVGIPFLFPDHDTVLLQIPIEVLRPNKDDDEVAYPGPNQDQFEAVQGEQEPGNITYFSSDFKPI